MLLVEALIVPIVWLENIQILLLQQLVPLVPQVNMQAVVDGTLVVLVMLEQHQMLSAAPLKLIVFHVWLENIQVVMHHQRVHHVLQENISLILLKLLVTLVTEAKHRMLLEEPQNVLNVLEENMQPILKTQSVQIAQLVNHHFKNQLIVMNVNVVHFLHPTVILYAPSVQQINILILEAYLMLSVLQHVLIVPLEHLVLLIHLEQFLIIMLEIINVGDKLIVHSNLLRLHQLDKLEPVSL